MLRCIGSEVFWNAELIRLLEFSGTLGQRITGEPFARSLERVAGWINLPIFVSIVVVFSVWIAMRVGAIAALLTAFGMLAHPSFYAGFAPNYFDHHGLLTACAFGTILGAAFMGAGWVMRDEAPNLDRRCGILPQTRRQARNGALASALCAGLGMWTSAPSVIPVIAIVGIAGAATTLWSLQTMERRTLVFDATLWRLWGRTGALISAAAYLVEYAPHTMRMRLEVNHPLYAVAWISGAELVASFGDWRANGIKPRFGRIVLAVLGLIASPVSIAIGGTRVFVLSESGLLRLHSHIAEFQSIGSAIHLLGDQTGIRLGPDFALLALAITVLAVGRKRYPALSFAALVAVGCGAMALFEFRWWLNAAAAELVLMVAVWTSLASNRSRASRSVALAVCILAGLLVFTRIHGIVRNVSESAVTPADAMQPIYRDAASAIRNTRPESSVVLLSSPNASTSITYFGRFKAIGTLYWEDVDGLRAAAKILTSSSDDQARVLLQARGITHIALFSRDNFVQEYLELLGEPDQPVNVARTFGYRLLSNGSPPPWLRPIGLRLPGAAEPGLTARIYQIVPEQNELEARWNLGIARLVEGDTMTAESTFLEAINGVTTARRSLLYATAGAIAYQQKAQALAVRLLGLALPSADDRQVRVNLAWILATSVDGRIRDGARAFALIEPVARAFPENASVLDVYAAALAETGRFPQAAEVMSRTLELGKQAMRGPDLGKMSERLNAYRSGRPWRQ